MVGEYHLVKKLSPIRASICRLKKRDLAMVFQDYALWPHLTAVENVGYALKRRNLDDATFKHRVGEALEQVGLLPPCD